MLDHERVHGLPFGQLISVTLVSEMRVFYLVGVTKESVDVADIRNFDLGIVLGPVPADGNQQ